MVVATLIGDVVGSRSSEDRGAMHRAVTDALEVANELPGVVTPLRVTVGDEYQGCFASLGEAITAALVLRLRLMPEIDVRHGLGWGDVTVLQEEPRVEDGPGWWAARAAIEDVELRAQERATRALRTGYALPDDGKGADPAAVNAALLAHDLLLDEVNGRGLSVLRGMLSGMTQVEIAALLDVSPSAVSQRVRGGLESLRAVQELLAAIR